MSNETTKPQAMGIPTPTQNAGGGLRIGDVTHFTAQTELANGSPATVGTRIGDDYAGDSVAREARRIAFLASTYAPSLTEGLEKEVKALTEKLEQFDGYDREGKPLHRFTGRERDVLTMKWVNRTNALRKAQQQRQQVETIPEAGEGRCRSPAAPIERCCCSASARGRRRGRDRTTRQADGVEGSEPRLTRTTT